MMRALRLLTRQHWAIDEEWIAPRLGLILDPENEDASLDALAARSGRPLAGTRVTEVRDGVAVIPISGPIFRHANMLTELCGYASLGTLAKDFNAALADPAVAGIVFDIDSPGGEVTGVNEMAGMIHAARGTKPVLAYVSGIGASGAYWLASAADEVVADATALIGSIGVVATLRNDPKARERTIEIVSSRSPNKRPDVSTEEGRSQILATIDALADVFIGAVARNRGMDPEAVVENGGQGGLKVGADAVAAGLADRLGSLEQVISEIATRKRAQVQGRSGAAAIAATHKETLMEQPTAAATPEITAAYIAEQHAGIADHFRAEGRQAGAVAERERILGIEAQALPGHADLIASLKADGKTTPEQAAVLVLAAERKKGDRLLESRRADEAAAPKVQPSAPEPAAVDENLPLEQRCEAEWNRDPKVRESYGSLKAYTAFKRNESRIRIHSPRAA